MLFTGFSNSPSWARTNNPAVNSRVLYHWAIEDHFYFFSSDIFYALPHLHIPSKLYTDLSPTSWSSFFFLFLWRTLKSQSFGIRFASSSCLPLASWSSPRPISSSQLHALLHFHPCPIYLVVFKGSYFFRMGHLISRGASRLDAFSVYPVPTWLLCHGLGRPADAPAVGPSRSSRTKDGSSQISCAHAG